MEVLAVDVGTSQVKAQLFDASASALAPPWRRPVPSWDEGRGDAEKLCQAVEEVLDEACSALPSRADPPAAIGLSCAWHALVGVDRDGRPTTPLTTWQDRCALRAAEEVRARVGDEEAVRRRTGAPIHPSFPAARLRWWSTRHPEVAAATARWCSLGELLERRWLGADAPASASMASATGCFDQEAGHWDPEVLEATGTPASKLARVDDGPRPPLLEQYRRRWPVLAGVPWTAPLGDGAAALLATATAPPPGATGRPASLSIGTTAAVRVLASAGERAGRPPALFAYLVDFDRVVLGAARSNGGNLVDWALRVLRLDAGGHADVVGAAAGGHADVVGAAAGGHADVVGAALARLPGAHGLRASAALAGERSPDWPLDASGGVTGMRSSTSALDLLAALLEAAGIGIARCVEALESAAGPLAIVCSGGAARRSPAWVQLVADAAGRTVWRSSVEEPSARGAAIAALERQGKLDAGAPPASAVHPDPARSEALARLAADGC